MIFVTGASGNVGAAVLDQLCHRPNSGVRIGARRPSSVSAQTGIEVVPFNFLDARTFLSAVQGCRAVFLLRPPAISDTRSTLIPFLKVARAAGVQQVVFVSVAGAGDNPLVPHHAVEQFLRQDTQGWTILRPGFFAQNLGDAYREDIRQDNRIFVPAGAGRVAFIDVRDLADVAVTTLLDPVAHQGQTYTLTGPEALSFMEVARLLSEVLGRPITYRAASIPGYGLHLRRRGLPLPQILVQTILHVGLRFGQAETVDHTLDTLLEHKPRTLRNYIQDYRDLWLKPS